MSNASAATGGQGNNAPSDEAWSWKRRWLTIAIVFLVHIGLIFAFSDRRAPKPHPNSPSFTTSVVFDLNKLPPMANPTLFALPHRKSFAGPALVRIPALAVPPFRWTEPARFLSLPVEALDTAFERISQEKSVASFQFEFKPPARLAIPFVPEVRADSRTNSTVRLSDELAKRRLLTSRELPSQPPRPELLTNTVLRVVVGADGLVASAIQVKQPSGSGSEKADREALDFAKAMRFAPLPAGTLTPSIGTIVFEWHIAPTNSPSGTR